MGKPFRILSLDGGGVRALLQLLILERFQQEYPNLINEADMITGVSAGSLVAIALALNLTPSETASFWEHSVEKIFTQGYLHKFYSVDNTLAAPYNTEELKRLLEQIAQEKTLKDVSKKIVVPSFRVTKDDGEHCSELNFEHERLRWHPEYFHNFENSRNSDTRLVDVILRSSAAPTYFPIYQGYVDGGIFSNNPALAAVTIALDAGVKLEDIVVLSISTGYSPRNLAVDDKGDTDWGVLRWAPHIIDILLDANTESIGHSLGSLLNSRYHRIDPNFEKQIGLDDASASASLHQIASAVDIGNSTQFLDNIWLSEKRIIDGDHFEVIHRGDHPTPEPNTAWCNVM